MSSDGFVAWAWPSPMLDHLGDLRSCAGRPGDWIDIEVSPVKVGSRLAVGNATFTRDGSPIAHATGTFIPV